MRRKRLSLVFHQITQEFISLISCILLLIISINLNGQSLNELEQVRLKIVEEMDATSVLLEQYKSDNYKDNNSLKALQKQIGQSNQLIANLNKQLAYYKNQIDTSEIKSGDLTKKDLNAFAVSLYEDQLAFDDPMKKALHANYIKQVNEHIKSNGSNKSFDAELTIIDINQQIGLEQTNKALLEAEIKSIKDGIENRKKTESQLESNYNSKVEERARLNDQIQKLLFSSVKEQANIVSYSNFENTKGFLGWPMQKANIETRYGEQTSETNSNVKFFNTGLDITSYQSTVKVVFDGEIVAVSKVANASYTVIVKHDSNFYTVYASLKKVLTSKGEYISEGQKIGEAQKKNNGSYQIHFEIWNKKQNLNPYHWLQNN